MRRCQQCGKRIGVMPSILLRGDFCSKECSENHKVRELHWEASHDEIHNPATSPPRAPQDEALATIWTGILAIAKQFGRRQQLPSKRRSFVVCYRQGKGETPIYFINAGLDEFNLAQLMHTDSPIWGVDVPLPATWRDAAEKNDESTLPTIERLVAPYVAAVRDHLCSSSCVLAGYSFSALMAFETAHQLREQAINVELVVLVDGQASYPAPHQIALRKLQNDWKREPASKRPRSITVRLRNSWSVIVWLLTEEMKTFWRFFSETIMRRPGLITSRLDELNMPLRWGIMEKIYANSIKSYRLRRLDCRGILFVADLESETPFRVLDSSLGWRGLFSGGLEIIRVKGNHFTMIKTGPYVQLLAQEMTRVFSACRTHEADRVG